MNEDDFEKMTYAELEVFKWAGKFMDERSIYGEEFFNRVKRYCIHQIAPNELDSHVTSKLDQRIADFYNHIDTKEAGLLEYELGL
jgi:hypothetical protein